MRSYITDNEVVLNEKQKQKLMQTIDNLEKEKNTSNKLLFDIFFSDGPCE